MEFSVALRGFVDKYNPLETPTEQIRDYLLKHRTIYKIVLVANFALLALMFLSPPSPGLGLAIGLGLRALFYRLTIETNCIYKFSLPVYATVMSLWLVAIAWSCGPLLASLSLIPLIASVAYIVCDIDFEATHQRKSCCSNF